MALNGIEWHCMALHDMAFIDIAWHCMTLHNIDGIAWHCIALHGMVLHVIALHAAPQLESRTLPNFERPWKIKKCRMKKKSFKKLKKLNLFLAPDFFNEMKFDFLSMLNVLKKIGAVS